MKAGNTGKGVPGWAGEMIKWLKEFTALLKVIELCKLFLPLYKQYMWGMIIEPNGGFHERAQWGMERGLSGLSHVLCLLIVLISLLSG